MEILVEDNGTQAIQQAIDKVNQSGGGRVSFKPGLYACGTLYLKSNVELYVPAGVKLQGHETPDQYDDFSDPGFESVTPELSKKCLIAAANAENISITGCGEINGQGPKFYDTNVNNWDFYKKPPHPRPRMIQLYNCRNVKITDISLVDSPGWTCWFIGCQDMTINRIKIRGDQRMINNDGIDLDGCARVTISDSFFQTGDDCLILRAIRRNKTDEFACEDILVNNCILDSRCQGVRLGCPSDDTIRNCAFRNIIFRGEGAGINCNNPYRYLRIGCEGYLSVENVIFSDWQLTSTLKQPITINIEPGINLRKIDSVVFQNFVIKARKPIEFLGTANSPITHITLRNVKGQIDSETPLIMRYVDGLKMDDVALSATTGENVPLARKASDSWESMF